MYHQTEILLLTYTIIFLVLLKAIVVGAVIGVILYFAVKLFQKYIK